jgi:hypothetical protein
VRLPRLGEPARPRSSKPTVYAHVATDPDHPGELALQYWLYYVFNDWNNLQRATGR